MKLSRPDNRIHLSIAVIVAVMLLAGCVPPPAAPSAAPTAPQPMATTTELAPVATPAPASNANAAPPAVVTPAVIPAGWQVYTNTAGFAISYPATWTAQAQPDSNNGSIHTEALKGPEGEVDLSWGVGFGGACPPGYTTVKVAQGDIQTCYFKNADGTESWAQMSHPLPNAGFSGRAATSNAQPASHDMLLQILSTLTFAPTPAATPAEATYTDPFAYCAAVGTIDAADARYTGPKTPGSVLPIPVGPGTPSPFPEGSVYWRCMDGKVYTCTVGANIPCWTKANTSTAPNTGMQNFCKDQANADLIPAYAAGHETIYSWSCKNGVPVIGKQMFQVDAQGYITDYWQQIPNPAATPAAPVPATAGPATTLAAASLQPLSTADCTAIADGMAKTLGGKVTTGEAPISDWTTQQSGTGCQAAATGTGKQFASPDAVVKALAGLLVSQGWTEDPQLAAGGPTGMGSGFRKGGQVCLALAQWRPDASANCPKDQPISACQVTPAQQLYAVTLDCARTAAGTAAPAAADPLPSWNDGPAKTTILKFVADVTDAAGPSYVPPAERVAVFDNDGTLWSEKPLPVQAAFVFARIAALAPDHPEWRTTQPYQAVLEKDSKTLESLGTEDVARLVAATHAGMTEEEFTATVKAFLKAARHPRFNVPYTQAVYQPMLELLALLRANGFETYIVSGGGAQFMRAFAEQVYGIPPENVIGSSLQYEFRQTPEGAFLVRLPDLVTFNDRELKPANIQRHIGRRPILAAGNSDGDLAMFQYTGGSKRPYLNLLLVHDDAEREYDYLTGTDAVMTAAAQSPWMFVSLKRDFKTMFPASTSPDAAAAAEAPAGAAAIANPASQNCIKQGGKLAIETRGDGGQFGVCLFEDNRQCEEWALLRGQCPVGGLKITGYVTPAARFCAITGGQYSITGKSNTENEQGACALAAGKVCDAWDYFNGVCMP